MQGTLRFSHQVFNGLEANEILDVQQPAQIEPGGSNYSPWVSVLNLCNAAIRSGVLSFPFAFRVVITIFAIFVILPLSMKRNLRDLKWSSTISVLMLTYLTISLVVYGVTHSSGHPNHVQFFRITFDAFIALDIVVFAFQSHVQVIPIFSELADDHHPLLKFGKRNLKEKLLESTDENNLEGATAKRVQTMEEAIFVSMIICFICYCLVGVFGYMAFPDVESDLLKSFDSTNPFLYFARMGMAVVAMVCFPVQNHPARTILDDAITHFSFERSDVFSWKRHATLTLVLFGITLVLALLVTDLGMVFSILGSTGSVLVVFIIPGLLFILSASGHRRFPDLWEEQQSLLRPASQKYYGLKLLAGIVSMSIGALLFCTTCYASITGSI